MKNINPIIVNTDNPQFQSWFAGAAKIVADNYAVQFPTLTPDILSYEAGSRYIRIWRRSQEIGANGKPVNSSAHAFIDRTTGDVLKPATWKAPAKHARGNIFHPDNGLDNMGPYGPAYLKRGRKAI